MHGLVITVSPCADAAPIGAVSSIVEGLDQAAALQVKLEGPNRRTFPVPQFDPLILRVRAQAGAPLTILQVIPVTTTDGSPVSGLPNDATLRLDRERRAAP